MLKLAAFLCLSISAPASAYIGGSLRTHTHANSSQGGTLAGTRITGTVDLDTASIRGQLNAMVGTFGGSVTGRGYTINFSTAVFSHLTGGALAITVDSMTINGIQHITSNTLVMGNTVGIRWNSGSSGQILIPSGVGVTPALAFAADPTMGFSLIGGRLGIYENTNTSLSSNGEFWFAGDGSGPEAAIAIRGSANLTRTTFHIGSDADTGLHQEAGNVVSLVSGGLRRVAISASGSVTVASSSFTVHVASMTVGTGTAAAFAISDYHISAASGPVAAIGANCGGSGATINGNDRRGRVRIGENSTVNNCEILFGRQYASAPVCVVVEGVGATTNPVGVNTTPTQMFLTSPGDLINKTIYYICIE